MSRIFYLVIALTVILSTSAFPAATGCAMHPDLKTLLSCDLFAEKPVATLNHPSLVAGDSGCESETWGLGKTFMLGAGGETQFSNIGSQSRLENGLRRDLTSGLLGAEPSGLISIGFGLLGLAGLARQRRFGGR